MDTTNTKGVTPKDFFLWLGALISLAASLIALINLLFAMINAGFPDPAFSGVSGGSPTYAIATLIVVFPLFILIMRFIRRDIERDSSRIDIWVRRWALFLVLFSAAAAFVGDLIIVIFYYLNGEELSARFLLKVAVILLIAGGGFLHFLADVKGYWHANQKKARMVALGAALLIILVIAGAFAVFGSPAAQRAARLDLERVSDLQSIQWQIVNYYQAHEMLPQELSALNNPLEYFTVPTDPATGAAYEYTRGAGTSFSLCAVFESESNSAAASLARYPGGSSEDTWEHSEGRTCFERTIDPARYPPLNKK